MQRGGERCDAQPVAVHGDEACGIMTRDGRWQAGSMAPQKGPFTAISHSARPAQTHHLASDAACHCSGLQRMIRWRLSWRRRGRQKELSDPR